MIKKREQKRQKEIESGKHRLQCEAQTNPNLNYWDMQELVDFAMTLYGCESKALFFMAALARCKCGKKEILIETNRFCGYRHANLKDLLQD